ncbi:hypothetical protein TNCT_457541 [Trichonephila clavata]|uniref:Uncharacterized protein n=1 Tax=Trichonephila clavata TaxID=2740835 RepID=A0A8X6HWF9_TRICU|nr:hypothetical protein TNCT_457541 [Trichonephila clavata]
MKAAALRFRSQPDDKSSGILFLFGNGRGPGAKEMMIGTFLIPPLNPIITLFRFQWLLWKYFGEVATYLGDWKELATYRRFCHKWTYTTFKENG